jgi:hypothetical protein
MRISSAFLLKSRFVASSGLPVPLEPHIAPKPMVLIIKGELTDGVLSKDESLRAKEYVYIHPDYVDDLAPTRPDPSTFERFKVDTLDSKVGYGIASGSYSLHPSMEFDDEKKARLAVECSKRISALKNGYLDERRACLRHRDELKLKGCSQAEAEVACRVLFPRFFLWIDQKFKVRCLVDGCESCC